MHGLPAPLRPGTRGGARRLRSLAAALLALGLAGCQGLDVPIAQWRAGFDQGLTRKISKEEKDCAVSDKIEEPRTLLGRWLNPKGSDVATTTIPPKVPSAKSGSTLILGSDGWRPMLKPKANPEADKELDDALKLFQQGKLAEAETAFGKIAKKRKGTHWGEKSQYYVAESQYQQKKYVKANDSFERLYADYPGTEFLDKLVSREYCARPDVALPERSRGQARAEAALVHPLHRRAASASTPGGPG